MNQKDRIRQLLTSPPGEWVILPRILDLRPRIAQYNTRIYELRAEYEKIDMVIEEKGNWINGEQQTRYRLVSKQKEKQLTLGPANGKNVNLQFSIQAGPALNERGEDGKRI